MSQTLREYTADELWALENALHKRYDRHVEFALGDTDIPLAPNSPELTECPAVCWEENDASFIICKTGENHYRGRFFYEDGEQFATDREEYDNFSECVTVLLRLQADHEHARKGITSGKTGSDLQ